MWTRNKEKHYYNFNNGWCIQLYQHYVNDYSVSVVNNYNATIFHFTLTDMPDLYEAKANALRYVKSYLSQDVEAKNQVLSELMHV